MLKTAVIGFILALAITAYSQEREYKTLVDFDQARISGKGGPFMQFTAIDGEFAHLLGGGGAIMVDDFFFGGYGIGLTNRIQADRPEYRVGDNLSVGHGGFWLGYSLFGERPVHVAISTLIGWGEIGIKGDNFSNIGYPDNIFVVTPTLEVELNLTHFFRMGVGATYNLFTFVDLPGYTAGDFSAPGGFISFQFGWF
ncbi:MAG: hypothetical protein ABFS10_12080 [Bacteroidota bacterium]